MLKIVAAPADVLSKPSEKVEEVDGRIRKLVKEMEETLVSQKDPQGVGLAAPQVGESLRLFIIKPKPEAETEVFINPRVLQTVEKKKIVKKAAGKGKKKDRAFEGCLSIHRIWAPVHRAHKVELEYTDLDGTTKTKWFTGFKSIIIQHEVDHLNGILFTQRATEQNAKLYEEKDGKLKKLQI